MTSSQYETSDVYLASFLLCSGAVLLGYEHVTHRRVAFRFSSNEQLHALLRFYWSNTPAPLVPLSLFTSLRDLKSHVRRKPGKGAAPLPGTPSSAGAGSAQADGSNKQSNLNSPLLPC